MQFPTWWTPGTSGSPDVEKLMRALFAPLLGGVNVVSWLPKLDVYEAQLGAGNGYLRAFRAGGIYNHDQNRDEPKVQFAALTRSRDDSWALIEFVRTMLDSFREGGTVPGTPHPLRSAGEVVGPQLVPEAIADDRLVPITVQLYTWRPKGQPNYRTALGL